MINWQFGGSTIKNNGSPGEKTSFGEMAFGPQFPIEKNSSFPTEKKRGNFGAGTIDRATKNSPYRFSLQGW
jgi:hypothetical protein